MHWRRAEAAWEKAEAADLEVVRSKQQWVDAQGAARAASPARSRAIAWFEQPSVAKRPGGEPTPPSTCSGPMAGSTTARRARDCRGAGGSDRRRLVEGAPLPDRPPEPEPPGSDAPTAGAGRT